MAAISGLIAIMFLLMIVLFKHLAPPSMKESDVYHVTVKLDKMDEENLDNKLSESTKV